MQKQSGQWGQLLTLISVFFFWGFVAAGNDILIPVFKKTFNLSQSQGQLVSLAFYVAYSVGSIIYGIVSNFTGGDLLEKIGYKNGIALGLCISAAGTLLFYPAAVISSFTLMISGLFVVGLGFALQQIAANPLTIAMGSKETGSQRLSLAGGVNNFGTTIGPQIISFAIFGSIRAGNTNANIESVKIPYLILGLLFFLVVAVILKFSNVPDKLDSHVAASEKKGNISTVEKKSALSYPQLWMGMIAIFVYVGVEVATASNLPEYLKIHAGINSGGIAPFVSLYWASLMIGRWTASVGAFGLSLKKVRILSFLMPYFAFSMYLLVTHIAGFDIIPFLPYGACIFVLILCNYLSKESPSRMLLIFSIAGILSLITGMFSTGRVSIFAFAMVGLFCSTLWPCIFTLALTGLGKHTGKGSSFLIMMIMGGGIVSFVQGSLANENMLGIKLSYFSGVACFAYIAFYAFIVPKILRKQELEENPTSTQNQH